jgi:hypothetical protein
MRSGRNTELHDVDVSGGGTVITGIVIGGIALLVAFFIFAERIFPDGDREKAKVELVVPEVDAPAK